MTNTIYFCLYNLILKGVPSVRLLKTDRDSVDQRLEKDIEAGKSLKKAINERRPGDQDSNEESKYKQSRVKCRY